MIDRLGFYSKVCTCSTVSKIKKLLLLQPPVPRAARAAQPGQVRPATPPALHSPLATAPVTPSPPVTPVVTITPHVQLLPDVPRLQRAVLPQFHSNWEDDASAEEEDPDVASVTICHL